MPISFDRNDRKYSDLSREPGALPQPRDEVYLTAMISDLYRTQWAGSRPPDSKTVVPLWIASPRKATAERRLCASDESARSAGIRIQSSRANHREPRSTLIQSVLRGDRPS